MLEANLFCHDTGGGSLGLDDATGEILLTRRVELVVADVGYLSEAIETLVAAAMQWKSKIAGAAMSDESIPPAGPAEPLPFHACLNIARRSSNDWNFHPARGVAVAPA